MVVTSSNTMNTGNSYAKTYLQAITDPAKMLYQLACG